MSEIQDIAKALQKFSDARDWHQFHSPKNLATALIVEAAELLEHFQWITEEQSRALPKDKLPLIAEEIADVQIYLIQLATKLNIDIARSVKKKIAKNAKKYPAKTSFGNATKPVNKSKRKP